MRVGKIQTLINALNDVATSLESGSVHYDYKKPNMSNMGLFCQALFGQTGETFITTIYNHTNYTNREVNVDWWSTWVKKYWPMGSPPINSNLIKRLYGEGLDREDISYIQNLNHPEVNKLFAEQFDFQKTTVDIFETKTRQVTKRIYKTLEWTEEHFRKDWWGKLWGYKETVTRTQEIEDGIELVDEEYEVKIGTKEVLEEKNPRDTRHIAAYFKLWAEYLEKKNRVKIKSTFINEVI